MVSAYIEGRMAQINNTHTPIYSDYDSGCVICRTRVTIEEQRAILDEVKDWPTK